MKIQVTKKSQYGRERVFPVDGKARMFAELIGRGTFRPDELKTIQNLGFSIEYV